MNFRAVVDAVEDLKDQFREMALRKSKPSEFGLMIKESPETLKTAYRQRYSRRGNSH